MLTAPIPVNEKERLESLRSLEILDTEPEERFDRITRLATKIFNVPISTVTLVDANREWYKSVCGLEAHEGDRAISFCGHAMLADEIFIVPDTTKDERFADNPMVIGEPFIRFYAGVPLISSDGHRIGTFCIKAKEARELTEEEKDTLKGFGKWVELEINVHNLSTTIDSMKKSITDFGNFFEISHDLMCVMSISGYFVRANKTLLSTLGYELSDLLSKPLTEFVHPEDKESVQIELKSLKGGEKTFNFICRLKKKTGGYICLELNATPEKFEIYMSAREIPFTDEKKEELRLLNEALKKRDQSLSELKVHIDDIDKD